MTMHMFASANLFVVAIGLRRRQSFTARTFCVRLQIKSAIVINSAIKLPGKQSKTIIITIIQTLFIKGTAKQHRTLRLCN